MSFADWAAATAVRFRHRPARKAAAASLSEFTRGARSRLRVTAAGLPPRPGTARCRVAGLQGRFHVTDTVEAKRALDLNGEAEVASFLAPALDAGAVFWDVGAYRGHYAVLAANTGAAVVAFEPHPENRARVTHHCSLNSVDIDLRAVALSDRVDTALIGGPETNQARVNTESGRETQLVRGDDVSAPRPSVVKIDVEGHELEVLAGLRETLSGVERVAVEVHTGRGVEVSAVAARLEDAGLRVRELDTPRSQVYLAGVRA